MSSVFDAASSKSEEGHVYKQWAVAATATMAMLNYGLQSGWISPMTKVLQSEASPIGSPLSDNAIAWMASSMCLAAMFAVPIYSFIAEKYGRKVSVIIIAVPQALCWIIKLAYPSVPSLFIARICCGIGAGGCFNIVPMYTKEISQDNIRGTLGAFVMLLQNIGWLIMYAMGAYLDYFTVLWIVIGLPILMMLLMLKAPESPAFLIKMGRWDEAAATVAMLRGLQVSNQQVDNAINDMKNEDIYYKSLPGISFCSIWKNLAWRRSFFLVLALILIQACNGIFSIVTYAASILSSVGVTVSPELQSLGIPVFFILGSLLSMICVEKFGRKPLLATCLLTITGSFVILASVVLIQTRSGAVPGWLSVVAIVIAVFAHGAGVLPVPYIVMSEMFNFQIRAKVMGCIVMFAWFLAFIQLVTFAAVSNALGIYTMFYCFAGINLLGVVITLVLLPETKGKSVEQIEQEVKGKKEIKK